MKRLYAERVARTKAARLLRQVHSLGLLLKASVVRRQFRCGKPGCRCAKGHLHKDYVVTRKAGAKTQTVRIRRGREKEALLWLENWRRMKQLLDQLTSVEIEILRMPAVAGTEPGGRKRKKPIRKKTGKKRGETKPNEKHG